MAGQEGAGWFARQRLACACLTRRSLNLPALADEENQTLVRLRAWLLYHRICRHAASPRRATATVTAPAGFATGHLRRGVSDEALLPARLTASMNITPRDNAPAYYLSQNNWRLPERPPIILPCCVAAAYNRASALLAAVLLLCRRMTRGCTRAVACTA